MNTHAPPEADYQRIEREIASDDSPVGIDAKKTHVMILAKLESIERRLDRLEHRPGPHTSDLIPSADHALAGAVDTFDDTVARLRARGVDVDARAHAAIDLLERLTDRGTLEALGRIASRLESLEPLVEAASHASDAIAAVTDTFDEEVDRLEGRGISVDSALRNGINAVLYLGQRVSSDELEALGTLLRSRVLDPRAVDIVGRMGEALVEAAEAPRGSVGPLRAVTRLTDDDAKRSTAFIIEFARRFGAALERTTDNGDQRHA
ncbi:MAG: hypothetical protein Tsb0013_05020 [Phycisphaerales bacterium]